MGINLSGEDSSELGFLLVENYNYDCFCWRESAGNFWHTHKVWVFSLGFVAGLRA